MLGGAVLALGGLGYLRFNGDLIGCLLLSASFLIVKELRFYIWTGVARKHWIDGLLCNLIGIVMVACLALNLDWATRNAYFMTLESLDTNIYTVIAESIFAGMLATLLIRSRDGATVLLVGILFGIVGPRLATLELMYILLGGGALPKGLLYLFAVFVCNMLGGFFVSGKGVRK